MGLAPHNYGGIIGQGQALVPDFAARMMQERLAGIQEQQAAAQLQRAQAAAAEEARTAAQQAEYNQAVAALGERPTVDGLAALMVRFPQASEGVKRAYDALDEREQRGLFTETAEVASALDAGRVDLALSRLERRAEADRAAGREVSATDQTMIDALRSGDPRQIANARQVIGRTLAAIGGPNNYGGIRGADAPRLRNVSPGDVVLDERTGEVAQSPVPMVSNGPGGIIEYPLMPGVTVLGARGATTPPTTNTAIPTAETATPAGWNVISAPGAPRDGGRRTHAGYDMFNESPEWRPAQPFEIRNVREGPRQGITADILFPNGDRIVAMHLRERPRAGNYAAGDLAGIAGNTGNARTTPPHIHAEGFDAQGNRIDPRRYFGVSAEPDPVRVRTRQQYERLASGTEYIAPDGTRRTKP